MQLLNPKICKYLSPLISFIQLILVGRKYLQIYIPKSFVGDFFGIVLSEKFKLIIDFVEKSWFFVCFRRFCSIIGAFDNHKIA